MLDPGGGGGVVQVTPAELCVLADQLLETSKGLTESWLGAEPSMSTVSGGAAGDTPRGGPFVAAHGRVVDAASVALGRLAGVLEQDMDDLYLTALGLGGTDEATARRFRE